MRAVNKFEINGQTVNINYNDNIFSSIKEDTLTSRIFKNFLLDMRIYTDKIPKISLFQIKNKNNEYAIQFTYVNEDDGVYYINYHSTTKTNIILTKTADKKQVELIVDWSVIPDEVILSTQRNNMIISNSCLHPLIEDVNNNITNLKNNMTLKNQKINGHILTNHYIKSDGSITEHNLFDILKCYVNTGNEYILEISDLLKDNTNAYSYAIYNNIDSYDNSTLLTSGPKIIPNNNGIYNFTIPNDGEVLLITLYKGYVNVYDSITLKDELNNIDNDIKTLSSNFYVKHNLNHTTILKDKYISSPSGNISEYAGYISKIYDVSNINTAYLKINDLHDDTGAMTYAIYEDYDIYDSTTAIIVGDRLITSMNGIITKIDIPQNAKILITTIFNANLNKNATSILFEYKIEPQLYIENTINQKINQNKNSCYVEIENDVLKYCSKYNKDYDLIIHFKYCMNNNIMTFTNVGLAQNTDIYPNTNFNRDITMLNNPGSDNIGPFNVQRDESIGNGVGGFTGGNHCYNEVYGENEIHTAISDNYIFYLDDNKIENGFKGYGNTVKVLTENTIFDTRVAPLENETILNSPLIKEMVSYTLSNTQIEVCATHRFLKDATVSYYGQQSVFQNESHVITPLGAYPVWTEVTNLSNFIKKDYPNFKAVSLKSNNGYENDILINCGLGTRYMLDETSVIFTYSSNKTYTQLLNHNNIKQDDIIYWSGIYNWGCIIDDECNYIYKYKIGNKNYLNICSKQQYKNILVEMPINIINSKIKSSGEHITVEDYIGKYIILNSDGIGSITIEIE